VVDSTVLSELGIPKDYGRDPFIPRYDEASELEDVGPNIVGRMQQLTPDTASDWRAMNRAAADDGIELLVVSGFRSIARQVELFRNKLESGQDIETILRVNAAPGFSQHHTGCAIDVATPGSRPLTEEFELSPAFDWLGENGARFGFRMPYGRDNVFGFCYEPWHWSQVD